MNRFFPAVGKPGRCVIITEAPRTCSFASEIAANLAEAGLLSLLSPVQRVTAPDVVVPLARLENDYMPTKQRIMRAVRKVMEFA